MYDHIGAIVLLVLAAVMLTGGLISAVRQERRREEAKRRHPSVRTSTPPAEMTDAERRYHSSNQWGR
jgi:hypothetical protein